MFTIPITYYSTQESFVPFITQWKTDNAGSTNNDQINFRAEAASDFNINWGDGNDEDFVGSGDLIHTYAASGTYTVTVTGDVTFSLINNGDNSKLVDVLQHGSVKYLSGIRTLFGSSLTVMSATDVPDLSLVTSMRAWFLNCGTLTSITNFDQWDVSTITDSVNVFSGCTNFDDEIPTFSAATTTQQMFQFCSSYTNGGQPIPVFSSSTNTSAMYSGATSFNQDVNTKFPVTTNTSQMFDGCSSYNNGAAAISGFNGVTDANFMYRNCTSLNVAINGFTSCTTATSYLDGASIFNSSVTGFTVVTNTSNFFRNAVAYNQSVGFPVSQITVASGMYDGATSYNQVTNGYTNTTLANSMFNLASAFNNGGVAMTGYNSLTNTNRMFRSCTAFNQDTSALNVSAVTDSSFMYNSCASLNSPIPTSSFNASTNASNMFNGSGLFNQPIGANSFAAVTNASGMFRSMTSFNQPLVNLFANGNLSNTSNMFNTSVSFDQDISSWNVTSLTNAALMFNSVTLSTVNYDALLVGWDAQSLQSGVSFSAGNSTYTLLSAADTARNNMITVDMWSITDGGGV